MRTAHRILGQMPPEDQARWGAGPLSYVQAVDVLNFYHRDTWFSFDIDRYGDQQRIKDLEDEIARLREDAD
jgi:hypothetical protein